MIKEAMETLRDRRFWAFAGSGLIVSVAYMDPGNWGTAISGGAFFNYALVWVVVASSLMAMLFQYLSGKLGLSGHSLADIVRKRWGKYSFVYWVLAEISILATDLAEFLGIVVALKLLFGIPMSLGVVIAIFDVLLFVVFSEKSFRALEYAFAFFVAVIGISYVVELAIVKPSLVGIVKGLIPRLNEKMLPIAIGIIGATVMPHALFIHSWLLKRKRKRRIPLRYHTVENVLSLSIAMFINIAILVVSAKAFYGIKGVVSLEGAYKTLEPLYGNLAAVVFGIALLVAGFSSSTAALLAGDSIMEALTGFRISPIVRRVITRFVNAIPLLIAIHLGIEPLDVLVWSQVALSLLLPLPMLPLVYYTSKKEIMRGLVNKPLTTAVAWLFSGIIILMNAWLLWDVVC